LQPDARLSASRGLRHSALLCWFVRVALLSCGHRCSGGSNNRTLHPELRTDALAELAVLPFCTRQDAAKQEAAVALPRIAEPLLHLGIVTASALSGAGLLRCASFAGHRAAVAGPHRGRDRAWMR
jgi:hypothetical protein